jgi:hypothetical protein
MLLMNFVTRNQAIVAMLKNLQKDASCQVTLCSITRMIHGNFGTGKSNKNKPTNLLLKFSVVNYCENLSATSTKHSALFNIKLPVMYFPRFKMQNERENIS